MNQYYYVNRDQQSNGDHEVHVDGCEYMPLNRVYLGIFSNCRDAVREAKRLYGQTNGCYFCCHECHTQ